MKLIHYSILLATLAPLSLASPLNAGELNLSDPIRIESDTMLDPTSALFLDKTHSVSILEQTFDVEDILVSKGALSNENCADKADIFFSSSASAAASAKLKQQFTYGLFCKNLAWIVGDGIINKAASYDDNLWAPGEKALFLSSIGAKLNNLPFELSTEEQASLITFFEQAIEGSTLADKEKDNLKKIIEILKSAKIPDIDVFNYLMASFEGDAEHAYGIIKKSGLSLGDAAVTVKSFGQTIGLASIIYDSYFAPMSSNLQGNIIFYSLDDGNMGKLDFGSYVTNLGKCSFDISEEKMLAKGCIIEEEPIALATADLNDDDCSDLAIANRKEILSNNAYITFYLGTCAGSFPFKYIGYLPMPLEPYALAGAGNEFFAASNKKSAAGFYNVYRIGLAGENPTIKSKIKVEPPKAGVGPYKIAVIPEGVFSECKSFALTWANIDPGDPKQPDTAKIEFIDQFSLYQGLMNEKYECDSFSFAGNFSAQLMDENVVNLPMFSSVAFLPAIEAKNSPAGILIGDQQIYDGSILAHFFPIEAPEVIGSPVSITVGSDNADYLVAGKIGGGVTDIEISQSGHIGVVTGYPKVWQDLPILGTSTYDCPAETIALGGPKTIPINKAMTNVSLYDIVNQNGSTIKTKQKDDIPDLCQCKNDGDADGIYDDSIISEKLPDGTTKVYNGITCDICPPSKEALCQALLPAGQAHSCYNPNQQNICPEEALPDPNPNLGPDEEAGSGKPDVGELEKCILDKQIREPPVAKGCTCYNNDLDCDGNVDTCETPSPEFSAAELPFNGLQKTCSTWWKDLGCEASFCDVDNQCLIPADNFCYQLVSKCVSNNNISCIKKKKISFKNEFSLISKAYADENLSQNKGAVTIIINKGSPKDDDDGDGGGPTIPDISDCFVKVGRDGHLAAGIGPPNSPYHKYITELNDKVRQMFCDATKAEKIAKGESAAECSIENMPTDIFIGELGYYHVICSIKSALASDLVLYQLGGPQLIDDRLYGKNNTRPPFPPEEIQMNVAGKGIIKMSRDEYLQHSATKLISIASPAETNLSILPNETVLSTLPSIVAERSPRFFITPKDKIISKNTIKDGLTTLVADIGEPGSAPLLRAWATPIPKGIEVVQKIPELASSPNLAQFMEGGLTKFEWEGFAYLDGPQWSHPDVAAPVGNRGMNPNEIMYALKKALDELVADSNEDVTFVNATKKADLKWDAYLHPVFLAQDSKIDLLIDPIWNVGATEEAKCGGCKMGTHGNPIQALLPYLSLLAGLAGVKIWRRYN
jgi:hypothetical protein